MSISRLCFSGFATRVWHVRKAEQVFERTAAEDSSRGSSLRHSDTRLAGLLLGGSHCARTPSGTYSTGLPGSVSGSPFLQTVAPAMLALAVVAFIMSIPVETFCRTHASTCHIPVKDRTAKKVRLSSSRWTAQICHLASKGSRVCRSCRNCLQSHGALIAE